jgi:neutral ceramidase
MDRMAILFIASLFLLPHLAPAAAADGWKAGVAKVVITPDRPVWMSGYPRDRPAESTEQDLWAKALALEDAQGQRALLITMDLIGIDRATSQRVCEQLAARYGLERRQIALNASHTHCGPAVGRNLEGMLLIDDDQWQRVDEYTRQLIDQLVALAGEAIDRLQPSSLAWNKGYSTIAVNRRTNARQDVVAARERGELNGPSDFDVPVLAVRDGGGRLQAVVFGYACHATVLDVEYKWCGDYPGYAQEALEETHHGAVAMFWAGCGGDQAPRPKGTLELTKAYGRRLAASVEEVLGGAMHPISGSPATTYEEISLRLDAPPGREQLQQDAKSRNAFIARRAERLLAQLDAGEPVPETCPYPVQVWQLGELRWLFLGGEVVVDYALRLKRELGPATWIAGYSNDVMAYIPSLRVLREGGYEGANAQVYYNLPTRWAEDIESRIVDAVHRQCQPASGH